MGDAAVQQGAGGARDLADGVEIWVKGAPPKSYRVVGYLQSRHLDGADVAAMQRQIAQAVRAAGGDGAILTQSRRERGDGFVMGHTIVYDIEVTDELEVFRYE